MRLNIDTATYGLTSRGFNIFESQILCVKYSAWFFITRDTMNTINKGTAGVSNVGGISMYHSSSVIWY